MAVAAKSLFCTSHEAIRGQDMETWKVTKNEGKELKIILQNRSRFILLLHICYHMHFCKGRDFLFHKNNGNIIGVVAQVIVRKKPQIFFFLHFSLRCSQQNVAKGIVFQ